MAEIGVDLRDMSDGFVLESEPSKITFPREMGKLHEGSNFNTISTLIGLIFFSMVVDFLRVSPSRWKKYLTGLHRKSLPPKDHNNKRKNLRGEKEKFDK